MRADTDADRHLVAAPRRAGHVEVEDRAPDRHIFTYRRPVFWVNHEWLSEVIFYGVPPRRSAVVDTARRHSDSCRLGFHVAPDARCDHNCIHLDGARARRSGRVVGAAAPRVLASFLLPLTVFLLAHERHWWLPAVFLIWANCHGGVLLGFVLLGAGLGVQTLIAPRRWWRFGIVVVACVVAVTLTPLGLLFWTEIPRSLLRINQYTLDEWSRPSFSEFAMIPFWLILTAFLGNLAAAQPPPALASDDRGGDD